MNTTEAIRQRKSVRAYEDKPVPDDMVSKIIEAGQWAPNAGPYQMSVIKNAAVRRKINDRTLDAMISSDNEFSRQRASLPGYQPLYGAPILILVSAPTDSPLGAVNAALAAENMLIEATAGGLGSCYLMSPTRALNGEGGRDLAKEAGVPEGHTVQCGVIVGYAAAQNKFTLGERAKKGSVKFID